MSRPNRPYGKFSKSQYKRKEFFEAQEAPTCKYFGCGKALTPTEYLFGNYCFKHSQIKNNGKGSDKE